MSTIALAANFLCSGFILGYLLIHMGDLKKRVRELEKQKASAPAPFRVKATAEIFNNSTVSNVAFYGFSSFVYDTNYVISNVVISGCFFGGKDTPGTRREAKAWIEKKGPQ